MKALFILVQSEFGELIAQSMASAESFSGGPLMKSMRLIIAIALLALSFACLPSANAATPAAATPTAVTSTQQGTQPNAASSNQFLFDFVDGFRDPRPTRAPEMPNFTGKLAAAFLAFLGYLVIRRRHAFNHQA